HRFFIGFDGKGANQCIQAARMGAKTAMVYKVIRFSLFLAYVEQTEHAATGAASIIVNDTGKMKLVQVPSSAALKTIFNPAPAIADLCSDFFKASDVFCCSESELQTFGPTGIESMTAPPAVIFVSLSGNEKFSVLLFRIMSINPNGAGVLAFYMAHYPTMPLEEMARRANFVAVVSVQTVGTQTSFPFQKDLPTR
uniref:Uncharacterized protein n=1 Tax=Cyprinus carpio TaxID=7962 RepID=A0A8C2FWX0_CYPCA